MSEPILGEIRMFGFGFAPQGWAQCNGQLLPISQNTALAHVGLSGCQCCNDGPKLCRPRRQPAEPAVQD